MRRLPFFFLFFFCLSTPFLWGCGGYVFLPISQCKKDSDCLAQQFCIQDTCKERPTGETGTVGVPCKVDGDCLSQLRCQANACSPRPSEEIAPNTEKPHESLVETTQEPPNDGGSTELTTDGGPQEPLQPEQEPKEWMSNESIPEALPEPTPQAPEECVPGSVRACATANGQNKPCGFGQQLCLFDKTWDTCKPQTNIKKRWVLPDQREVCDEIDNDCDGYTDEGCASSQSFSCGAIYHVPFDAPDHHIALAQTGPLYQYGYAYHAARQIAVHHDEARKAIILSRLRFKETANDPRGPQYEWLLSLPVPVQGNFLASWNEQGSLLATYTNNALFVWEILYTADGTPHLNRSTKVNIKDMFGLHFVGDGSHLVSVFSRYDSQQKKTLNEIVGWQVELPSNQPINLKQRAKTTLPDAYFEGNFRNNPGFDPKTQLLVLASYTKAYLVDVKTLKLVKELPLEMPGDPEERSVVFHPTKARLVIAPVNFSNIFVFDISRDAQGIPRGTKLDIYEGSYERMGNAWGFHPTTGDLYTRSSAGLFRWKEPSNGQKSQAEFVSGSAYAHAIHHPSKIAAIAHNAGWWGLYSITTGKLLGRIEMAPSSKENIYSMGAKFTTDGKLLLIQPKQVELWELQQNPDGSASLKKKQQLLTISTRVSGSAPLAISEDGNTLAWSVGHSIEVWSRSNGGDYTHLHTLNGHTQPIASLTFHKSGKYLLSGSFDNQVRLWTLDATPASITLKTYTLPVVGVGFHEHATYGDIILATLRDGNTYAWSLTPSPNGLPQTTMIDGESKAFLSAGDQVSQVVYPSKKSYYFMLIGDSIHTKKMVKRDFYVGVPQGGEKPKLSESSVLRDFPQMEGVMTMDFAPQSAPDRNSFFYGFSSSDLRVWYCPF